jgi:arylsulfatase A-like enzyme
VPPYAGQFAGEQVDRADLSFNEADVGDKPRYIRELGPLSAGDQSWLDSQHQRRLECLLELDDHIATIWDALEERGRLHNTYVFLLTDNGYLLGQHRYYGKHVPYDGSARMPLYAYGPGFAAGAVDERLVGNVDLAPTLVDVAGADGPEMDGVSLLSSHQRDAILLEFLAPDVNSMKWPGPRTAIARYSAVRTVSHLYVEYRTGERELYDYGADPHETENLLAGTPPEEVAALAANLQTRLGELRACRGGSCL